MKNVNKNSVFKYLSELVNIPSYGTIDNNHPIITYFKDKLKVCEIIENVDSNGNTHLLVGVNCKLEDLDHAILLSGHIDTVKESKGHSPHVVFNDGCIEGLGTSDMKAFFASVLSQIDELKNLDEPIILSITSDEETKLEGVKKNIYELNKKNVNVDFVIIGEPTNLDYYASSRGNTIYVSIMSGKACHSSTPELGVNAIELEAVFINEIKKISKEYPSASICITSITGGKIPSNVVPDGCSICFGVRTSDKKTLSEIYNYLSNKHDEISKGYGESKLFSVLEFPLFEKVESFFTKYAEDNKISIADAKYSTEAGYFQRFFPNADIIIYGPGDPTDIHKAGEKIPRYNLLKYQEEFIKLINSHLEIKKQELLKNKKLVYNRDRK